MTGYPIFRNFFKEKEYRKKLELNEPLYYSHYLNELKDTSEYAYYGKLSKSSVNQWKIACLNKTGDTIMYNTYKTLVPIEKAYVGKYYYPDGTCRKIETYNQKGLVTSESRFHMNGQIHYVMAQNTKEQKKNVLEWFNKLASMGNYYKEDGEMKYYYQSNNKHYNWEDDKAIVEGINRNMPTLGQLDDVETFYLKVYDEHGISLLNSEGEGQETVFDHKRKLNITRCYKANQLVAAYYLNAQGDTVYQFCDRPLSISGVKRLHNDAILQQRLIQFGAKELPQGVFLLRCVVNEKGILCAFEVMNAPEERLQNLLTYHYKKVFDEISWKIAKKDNKKVLGEVVIPLCIIVKGYAPVSFGNNDMWMHNQMWMHQQHMNQPKFTPPTNFGGF